MNNTTIVSTPNYLSPLNNLYGNYFVLNNASSGATNFKYLAKLYYRSNDNVSGTFLTQELLVPRPGNGQGIYSPYKSLQSILGYDITVGNYYITGGDVTSDLLNYYIRYGFKYNPNLEVARILQVGTTSVPSGYFGLSFSSAHGFAVGDIIRVSSNNAYLNGTSSINGVFFNTSSFSIDRLFTTASNISTATVIDLERISGTSSNYYGYNGTRQYNMMENDYTNDIIMGYVPAVASTLQFLTDYPLINKKILSSQDETLSVFIALAGFTGPFTVKYKFYNSPGVLVGDFTNAYPLTATGTIQKYDIPVGTSYLEYVSTIPATTVRYTVQLIGSATYSELRTYEIDNECSQYDNVRVMWLNSYGVFDFFNFRKDDKKTYNVQKTQIKKQLPIPFVQGSREQTIINQQVRESHTINTDWISEDIYAFLSNLVISPEVYIIDDTNNYAYPIVIDDTQYEFKTNTRDRLFNLTINYTNAYGINTQNQ